MTGPELLKPHATFRPVYCTLSAHFYFTPLPGHGEAGRLTKPVAFRLIL